MIEREPTIYTIYKYPTDYPNLYVVRRFWIRPSIAGGPLAEPDPWALKTSLEAARKTLPGGLYLYGREPGDDPKIVESWI